MTDSGTLYFVEVRKSPAGAMRVVSDGSVVTRLRNGLVGGCHCLNEPVVVIRESMHLSENGRHIVVTSPVIAIEKSEGAIDDLVCSKCKYYKVGDHTCVTT